MFSLSSAGSHPPHTLLTNFCVERQSLLTLFLFNMVEIKLSVISIIAAVAIARIAALPLPAEQPKQDSRLAAKILLNPS